MSTDHDEPLSLVFLGTPSAGGNCPTAYATNRGTFVVQGSKVTDPAALAQLRERGLPDHETAVEIPASLLPYFTEGA
ncbi:hypothetical protein [Amycolatopsis sp. NPDC051128]|uniref:hypothetical protein n=1 Tax=Amycolatopsis sp. NPDC051128 TaxID=3155412 RepID=UPI003435704B